MSGHGQLVPGNNIHEAKERLVQERQALTKGLERINAVLAILEESNHNGSSPFQLRPVIPDEYKGMRMTRALEAYLKARPNARIPIDKVVEDLELGGADLGTPQRHRQNLKIAMRNLTWLVEWDEQWNMQLAPTANEPRKRGARKTKSG